MVESVEKCKKAKRYPVLKWQDVIFHLHNKAISEDFDNFVLNHQSISKSRCALAVLRKYYSTTMLRCFRRDYYNPVFRVGERESIRGFTRWYFYYLGKSGSGWC